MKLSESVEGCGEKNDPVEDVSKDLANKIKIMNYLKQSQSQLKIKIYC